MYRVGEQYYLWKVPVCMSGISVKNSWANCSPGHRLHITVKHRPTVVKMKGRSGGKDHMIQSASLTLTCSLPQTHFLHIILQPLLELLFWPPRRVQNWYINSAPPPPTKKGGFCLPAHAFFEQKKFGSNVLAACAGVCLCLRPNLIPGFSWVDWGEGGGFISFLT